MYDEVSTDSARLCCCIVAFIFVFIIMVFAICWTNKDNFENFTNVVKYNNDTIKNVLGGGFHYKALGPSEDILEKFKELEKKKQVALVAITAPWCGHCKHLKKSGCLRKVAKQFPVLVLDDKHPQVADIMHMLQAQGFPTLGIFYQGDLLPYNGDRNDKTILNTMRTIKNNIKPLRENFSQRKITTIPKETTVPQYNKLIKKMMKDNDKIVTIFMADWCGHCKNLKESKFPEKLVSNGIDVIISSDKHRLTRDMKIQAFPTIFFVKGGRNIHYNGDRDPDTLLQQMS